MEHPSASRIRSKGGRTLIWAAIRDCAANRTRIAPEGMPVWDWAYTAASILCEIDLSQRRTRTGPILLAARPQAGRPGRSQTFALALLDGSRLHLSHRRGPAVVELTLNLSEDELWTRLRVSYTCLPNGRAILTAELPDLGRIRQREAASAPALDPGLARLLVAEAGATGLSPDWVAAGAGRYRLGLGASVEAGTRIDTPDGPRPVEELRPGDKVLTHDGAVIPLTGTVRIEAPALGGFRPIRLSAPFLNLDRDIAVAPNARILLTGTDVEYLTGDSEVLVEARHLRNARAAASTPELPVVTWYGLVLPRAGTIAAHGSALAGVGADRLAGLGRIAAASALAPYAVNDPLTTQKPSRRAPACPRLLRGAEAQAVILALDSRHAPFAA